MKWSRWALPFVFSVLFAFTLAGAAMTISDDEDPVGAQRALWVNGLREGVDAPSREVLDQGLAELAVSEHISIARARPSRERPNEARTLYVADSPTGEAVARQAFSPNLVQEVLPLSSDPEKDPRAFYYVYGDDRASLAVVRYFESRGYVVQQFAPFLSRNRLVYVLGGFMAPLVGLVVMFTTMSLVAMALMSAREFGVLRLHGYGRMGIVVRVMAAACSAILLGSGLAVAAALLILQWYNGGADRALFVRAGLLFTAALWILCLAALVVGVILATSRKIPDSLRGRVDTMPAIGAVAVTHLVVVLLVATSGVSTMLLTAAEGRAEQRLSSMSGHHSPIGYATLSGSVAGNGREITRVVAQGLRRAAASGDVILADPGAPEAGPVPFPGGAARMLLINDTYLSLHPELQLEHRPRAAPSNAVTVLIPESRERDARAITEAVRKSYRDEAHRTGSAVPSIAGVTTSVRTWPLMADQAGLSTEAEVTDPITILVSKDLTPVSDVDITAMLTQSRLAFTSAQAGRTWVKKNGLETYVLAVEDEREAAQHALQKATIDLRRQIVALALGGVVLVMTAACLALLLVQWRAQWLHVTWLHGWSWFSRHGLVLGLAALTVIGVTGAWVALVAPDVAAGPLPPGEADRAAVRGGIAALAAGLSVSTFVISLTVVSSATTERKGARA